MHLHCGVPLSWLPLPTPPQESLKQYQHGDLQQFDLTQLILTVYCAKVMEVSGCGASP